MGGVGYMSKMTEADAFTPSLTSENLVSPGSPGKVIDQTSPEALI